MQKERLYPDTKNFRMTDDVLEVYIHDSIMAKVKVPELDIWFSWQGGEPTMLGIDFFRKVIALQGK